MSKMALEEFPEFYFVSRKSNKRIRIPIGDTVIGRGTFLSIKDMKVSRSHAVISLNDGKLRIKPMSSNPTFYWSDNKKVQLQRDIWKSLSCGDIVSFLPEDYIFTVHQDTPVNKESSIDDNTEKSPLNGDFSLKSSNEKNDNQKACKHDLMVPESSKDDNIPINTSTSEISSDVVANKNQEDLLERQDHSITTTSKWRTHLIEGEEEKEEQQEQQQPPPPQQQQQQQKRNMEEDQQEEDECLEQQRQQQQGLAEEERGDEQEEQEQQEEQGKLETSANVPSSDMKRVLPGWMATVPKQKATVSRGSKKPKDATSPSKTKKRGSREVTAEAAQSAKETVSIDCNAKEPIKLTSRKRTVSERDNNDNEVKTKHRKLAAEDEPVRSYQDLEVSECKQRDSLVQDQRLIDKETQELNAKGESSEGQGTQVKTTVSQCAPDKDESVKLPKCIYGKSCYRKNPAHFLEFTHSDASDIENDDSGNQTREKPECPYGTSCYRKNPQHKLEYKHTQPYTGPRQPARKSTRTKGQPKRSLIEGDTDDDGEQNDYDYDDSFIDDETDAESESSSHEDDYEDEDWSPDEVN